MSARDVSFRTPISQRLRTNVAESERSGGLPSDSLPSAQSEHQSPSKDAGFAGLNWWITSVTASWASIFASSAAASSPRSGSGSFCSIDGRPSNASSCAVPAREATSALRSHAATSRCWAAVCGGGTGGPREPPLLLLLRAACARKSSATEAAADGSSIVPAVTVDGTGSQRWMAGG
jgi:hypothetical protein